MQDRFTVAGLLRVHAASRPDAPMLVEGAGRRSWSAQYARSCQVAQALQSEGVGPGDRVAFLDRNGLAYFDVLFGCALLGAVNVAVNWRLSPVEMGAIVADARPAVLVVHPDYLHCLDEMTGGRPGLRTVVLGEGYEAWLADRPVDDPGHLGAPEEVSLQLYTSGTTGLPKGVMLTNANIAMAVSEAGGTFSIAEDTISLVAMPLFHIGGSGWALCGMSRGGLSIVLRDVDPIELLRLVEAERVTEAFLVPAVLMFLLAIPETGRTDLSSLRTIFYGASPIAEDVLVRCIEVFGCDFAQVYGMTETTGAICALRAEDHDPTGPRRHLLRSAGLPHPHVALRIVDPVTGEDAAVGDVGEIWTRSPYNMLGYWERPDETARSVTDGWLHTGDAGYLDEDGYLFLHDRIKDMIVTGGENVYPAEVENVLLSHAGVADAAVIGVPDARWGETVKAIVVRAPAAAAGGVDESVTDESVTDDVIEYCRARLAHYKCPTSVDVVASLPRNPSGKVLKRELRAPYWEGRDRSIQ